MTLHGLFYEGKDSAGNKTFPRVFGKNAPTSDDAIAVAQGCGWPPVDLRPLRFPYQPDSCPVSPTTSLRAHVRAILIAPPPFNRHKRARASLPRPPPCPLGPPPEAPPSSPSHSPSTLPADAGVERHSSFCGAADMATTLTVVQPLSLDRGKRAARLRRRRLIRLLLQWQPRRITAFPLCPFRGKGLVERALLH